MDVGSVVKHFLNDVCVKIDSGYIIDMTDQYTVAQFQRFIAETFQDVLNDAGSSVVSSINIKLKFSEVPPFSTVAYKMVMSGNNTWNEISNAIDKEDVTCIMNGATRKKFELERSGFILCMMSMDEDLLKWFKPAINDLIEHDIGEEYRQYKEAHKNDKPVMVDEDLAKSLPNEDEIEDKDLLMEYFKTCRALGNFMGQRNYQTEEECKLHDRLMRIYQRIYDKGC